jgi:hypothetical protein
MIFKWIFIDAVKLWLHLYIFSLAVGIDMQQIEYVWWEL